MKLLVEGTTDYELITEGDGAAKNYKIKGIFMMAETVNRNGRYYTESVLDREAMRYVARYVKENCAYGELDHPCHGPTAQALTETGWKFIKDVAVGEKVFTLNPDTRQIELQPVDVVQIHPFKGNMIRLKTRSFDTMVTPNHKFLTYYRDGKPYFITAAEIKDGIDNKVARLSKFAIPKAGLTSLVEAPEITVAGKTLPLVDFAAFMGVYLAEGCTTHRKGRDRSYIVQLFQNEGPKAERIRELLTRLPWKFNEHVKDQKLSWRCHDAALAEYLRPLGKAHEKYIPTDLLTSFGETSAKSFFEFYHLGDGRGSFDLTTRQVEVFSTSERLIDDISVVVAKMGLPTRKFSYIEENDVTIEGRVIKADHKRKLHFLKVLKADSVWLDNRHMTADLVPYEGDVYCLTLPNHVFLCRDNEYTFWTGNSSPNVNLRNVSHVITGLVKEGKNWIGEAKIVNTDMGRNAKGLIEAGVKLGVSSRGVGNLVETNGYKLVKDDYHLITPADLVADPSAPSAFVQSMMEGAEWIFDPARGWIESFTENAIKEVKAAPSRELEAVQLQVFERYLSALKGRVL